MADYVEALVAALKGAKPTVARIDQCTAQQQRKALAAALLGSGEVSGVKFCLAHQSRSHRFHSRFE